MPNTTKDPSFPLLSIRCVTYNQVKYIRKCLEGFVIQKTTFPFEIVVHDDASTDGTVDIIKEYEKKYPHLIKPIYEKENQYSKHDGSLTKILDSACRGKYIAYCEGDDYWTDPYKLQKQVDFLEANPDYGMVRTGFDRFYQSTRTLEKGMFEISYQIKDNHKFYIMHAPFVAPCTWVYRSSLKSEMPVFNRCKCFTGDIALLLEFSRKSKIKYLSDITSVYRILQSSASHLNSDKKKLNLLVKMKNTRLLYAKLQSLSFRLKFWMTICRSYRNLYKQAGCYSQWFKMCVIDFGELFFTKNKYFNN